MTLDKTEFSALKGNKNIAFMQGQDNCQYHPWSINTAARCLCSV